MASDATTDGACRLLKLPAELRLIIYGYALRAPNGVKCESVWDRDKCFFRYFPLLFPIRDVLSPEFFHVENASAQAIVCSTTELNQLKYVCRQLNNETKSLTLSVNEVIFEESIAEFIDFLQACPPAVLQRLRVVTIMSSELKFDHRPASKHTRKAIDSLRNFCVQYTEVTVRLRHECLHPEEYSTIRGALHFQMYYRNESALVKHVSEDEDEQAATLALITAYMSGQEIEVLPKNLRVYPPFAVFDEQSFIERMQMFEDGVLEEDSDEEDETFEEESERMTKMLTVWHKEIAVIKKIFEHGA